MEFLHLLFLLAFLYTVGSFLLRKLRKYPPSPPLSLPIIGHLYLFKKPLHRTLANLSDKYGPVMLLQFGSRAVLHVSSPTAAEECLTRNDAVFANRPRLLAGKHLGYNYTTIAWAPYGDHLRNLRRLASLELLSVRRIQTSDGVRSDEVRSLVKRLAAAGGGEIRSALFEMVLNIIMRMICGKRYYTSGGGGAGGDLANTEEGRRFSKIVKETFELSGASNVGDFLPILRWIGVDKLEKRLEVLQEKRDSFMQDLINEHKKKTTNNNCDTISCSNNKTLIDVLLSLQETDPQSYTDQIIRGLMQVMLSAGTDTSVTTMEWAMSSLLNNPETLTKAQNEIDNVVGNSRLVEDSDLPKLPYLQGIINETLRMYPAGPMLVPHESSAHCTVEGYSVPRGTMLLVNAWAIQNDPKLWDQPEKFRPERFVDANQENRGGFNFLPFGYGRRRCPGENLAMRVVGLTVGSLVQCFEWWRLGGEMVDMSEGSGLAMCKAQPLAANIRPRSIMGELFTQL
ncbi:hypothetical protein ABFS83_03G042900 [Erythranthe nasuta]